MESDLPPTSGKDGKRLGILELHGRGCGGRWQRPQSAGKRGCPAPWLSSFPPAANYPAVRWKLAFHPTSRVGIAGQSVLRRPDKTPHPAGAS